MQKLRKNNKSCDFEISVIFRKEVDFYNYNRNRLLFLYMENCMIEKKTDKG